MALTAEQLAALALKPQAASGDAGSVTARSADDVLTLADRAEAMTALTGTNENGGPKSAWRLTRPAKFRPGSASE